MVLEKERDCSNVAWKRKIRENTNGLFLRRLDVTVLLPFRFLLYRMCSTRRVVVSFFFFSFFCSLLQWLEKYLSMIWVVITSANRPAMTMSSLSFPPSSASASSSPSFSSSFFFQNGKLWFLFVRTNAWTALKADGNLGFLAESESLTSEHDVSMLLCVMRMYGCRTDEKRGRL